MIDDFHEHGAEMHLQSRELARQFRPVARRVLWLAKLAVGKEVAVPRGQKSKVYDIAVVEKMSGAYAYVVHPTKGTMVFRRIGGFEVGNVVIRIQDPETVDIANE